MSSSAEVSATLEKWMKERIVDPRHVWGIPWGFPGLDNLTGGIHSGEMSLLMARPGVGKSLWAGQVALSAAQWLTQEGAQRMPHHCIRVVLCEMTQEAFQDRMACSLAGVNQRRVRSGFLSPEQQERYLEGLQTVAALPIEYLDNTSGLTETTRFLKGHSGQPKTAFWLLDYIGNHPAGQEHVDREDYRRVSYVSAGLRELSKSVCPGLVVVQMNRSVESSMRKDKRPMLSDLRDSGKLEQDASGVVMGLYRADIYQDVPQEDRHRPKPAQLIVLKQRNGPVGTVEMMWLPDKPGFADISELVDDLEGAA